MAGEGFPTNCLLEWLQAMFVGGVLCLVVGILSRGVLRLFLWAFVAAFAVSPCCNYWLFDPQWRGLWPSLIYTKAMFASDWPGIGWVIDTTTPIPTFGICFLGLLGFERGWFVNSAQQKPHEHNPPPPFI